MPPGTERTGWGDGADPVPCVGWGGEFWRVSAKQVVLQWQLLFCRAGGPQVPALGTVTWTLAHKLQCGPGLAQLGQIWAKGVATLCTKLQCHSLRFATPTPVRGQAKPEQCCKPGQQGPGHNAWSREPSPASHMGQELLQLGGLCIKAGQYCKTQDCWTVCVPWWENSNLNFF